MSTVSLSPFLLSAVHFKVIFFSFFFRLLFHHSIIRTLLFSFLFFSFLTHHLVIDWIDESTDTDPLAEILPDFVNSLYGNWPLYLGYVVVGEIIPFSCFIYFQSKYISFFISLLFFFFSLSFPFYPFIQNTPQILPLNRAAFKERPSDYMDLNMGDDDSTEVSPFGGHNSVVAEYIDMFV